MDCSGYNKLNNALKFVPGKAKSVVRPMVREGQEARFVTIYTSIDVVPANVLNALAKRGFLQPEVPRDDVFSHDPELSVITAIPGSISFEDINFPISQQSEQL